MSTNPTTYSLPQINLLESVSAEGLRRLERLARWKRYGPGEEIISRNSTSRDVYFVVSGRARVVNYSFSGREITLDDLSTGSYFGELAAIDGQPRSAQVVALAHTQTAALAPEHFLDLLRQYPDAAFKVMLRLTTMVRTSTDRIMDLSTLGANSRVQAEMLRRSVIQEDDNNRAVLKPIPLHTEIASRVSTTRETVARVLNSLSRRGIIERHKDQLVITNVALLREMIEDVRGD